MALSKSLTSISKINNNQNNNKINIINNMQLIFGTQLNTIQQKNQDYSNVRLLGVRLNINP